MQFLKALGLSATLLLATAGSGTLPAGIADVETYEAWYDTTITVPNQPVQKGKLHTYFDGKRVYSKQTDGAGNVSATAFEMPFDTTRLDYAKQLGATSVGKKTLDNKPCEGWQYKDQLMGRPTTNWFDDSGHFCLQEMDKYTGSEGHYEQRRTEFHINPKNCQLPADPEFKQK